MANELVIKQRCQRQIWLILPWPEISPRLSNPSSCSYRLLTATGSTPAWSGKISYCGK